MAKQTSFAHQKEVLEQFTLLLQNFTEEMNALYGKYGTGILSLYEQQGLMEEIYQDYKVNGYFDSIGESVRSIIKKINEEHIPFVEKEIDFITSRQ